MGKRLVIAEKPSMAQAIAAAIGGRGTKKDGFLDCGSVLITWARGHLLETLPPDKLNPEWKTWRLATLPMLPQEWRMAPRDDAKKQLKVVLDLVKSKDVDEIVNACDSGREGQLIFDEIMVHAKNRKPCLRLWTASLTDQAIKAAWSSLEPNTKRQGLTDAAWCRQRADWLVGLNATRVQTLMVQSHFQDAGTQNIGRVQTPTLKLLVDREMEIRNFVPKDFFQVFGSMQAAAGGFLGRWFRIVEGKQMDRLELEQDAKAILAKVQGRSGVVKSVTQKDEREQPDQLFDLTTLQREANKKHGFTAEKTLEIAQSLYEAKVTTYPRTNSRFLTPDVMSSLVPQALQSAANAGYGPFVAKIKTPIPALGKRFVDASKVEDHHAIIPTENVPGSLTPEQRAIYDMVARRLIGAFFPDRIVAKTEIITEIEGETFKTIGKVVKQEGWAEVDPASNRKRAGKKGAEDDEDDDAAGNLPAVSKGDLVTLSKGEIKRGKTSPPKPYSEGDLLGAMESAGKDVDEEELREAMKDSGLGTPATRASIIEELVRRKFVERKRTSMIPTELGIGLIRRIKHPILMSPSLTGEWEKALKEMERGKVTRESFLRGIETFVTKIVDDVRKEASMANEGAGGNGAGGAAPLELGKCPKCEGTLRVIPSRFGKRGYYAKCSDAECKVSFDCDATGDPDGGHCKFEGCDGIVKVTKGGSKICLICDRWQEEKGGGGAGASAGECPKCKQPLLLRKWEGAHYVKCSGSDCKVSFDTDDKGKPKHKCKFCKGPVKATRSGSKICMACDKWQEDKKS